MDRVVPFSVTVRKPHPAGRTVIAEPQNPRCRALRRFLFAPGGPEREPRAPTGRQLRGWRPGIDPPRPAKDRQPRTSAGLRTPPRPTARAMSRLRLPELRRWSKVRRGTARCQPPRRCRPHRKRPSGSAPHSQSRMARVHDIGRAGAAGSAGHESEVVSIGFEVRRGKPEIQPVA